MSGTTHQEELRWITSWFPLLGQDDVDQFLLVEKRGGGREKIKHILCSVAAAEVIIFTNTNYNRPLQRLN